MIDRLRSNTVEDASESPLVNRGRAKPGFHIEGHNSEIGCAPKVADKHPV